MRLRVGIESREHDGEDDRKVVTHQIDDVFVVPVEQRPLRNLEVLAVDASSQLLEQSNLDLLELDRICDIQHLLDLIQEHDFLWRIHLGPILEQTHHDIFGELRVFLQELHNAIRELRVI